MQPISKVKRAYHAADFVVGLLLGAGGGVAAFLVAAGLSELLVSALFQGASLSDALNSLVNKRLPSDSWGRGNFTIIVTCFVGALAGIAYAWRVGLARLRRLSSVDGATKSDD